MISRVLQKLRYTLGGKLILAYTLLVFIVAGMVVLGFSAKMNQTARNSLQTKMVSTSRLMASNVSSALFYDDSGYIREMLRVIITQEKAEFIVVTDNHGGVIAGFNEESSHYQTFLQSGLSSQVTRDRSTMNLKTPIMIEDTRLGFLYVGYSLLEFNQQLKQSLLVIYAIGLLLLLVGTIVVYLIGQRMMKPLHDMVQVVAKIDAGDTGARVQVLSKDEVGSLAETFNAMLDTLAKNTSDLKREVAIRKETEQGLIQTLQEKDTLLKEVHHRVKNNLQVITSLLHMQAQQTDNKEALTLLTESETRVRSMALVHNKLYRGHDLSNVRFVEYIRDLTADLKSSYHHESESVFLEIKGPEVLLDIEVAIPCGLIINELYTNAVKYAFPAPDHPDWKGRKRPAPRVTIHFQEKIEDYVLSFGDNGIGIKEAVDLKKPESFGLKMVSLLVEQLDGNLSITTDGGSQFSLRFPIMR